MYSNKKILALITARGGSRRLPGKNILPLLNKPLVAWAIGDALGSRYVDRVIVSTDDKKIAQVSKKYGAEVPFLRPKSLATDKSSSMDAVLHLMDWLERKRSLYDILVLLQPTSPLRISDDIDKALELLFSKDAKAVISVYKTGHLPHWTNTLLPNGCMKNFIVHQAVGKKPEKKQDFYALNGAVYLAYWDYIKKEKDFLGNETFAYIMPKERSIDIDDETDFKIAKLLIKENTGV